MAPERRKSTRNSNHHQRTSEIKSRNNVRKSGIQSRKSSNCNLTTRQNVDENDANSFNINGNEFSIDETREIFYKTQADTFFYLSDKKFIKISREMLYRRATTPVMFETLFNRSNRGVIDIPDFDSATFQVFLDCVMRFAECSSENAVIIFPLVCKYQIKNLMQNCSEVLKPEEMTGKSICQCLNVAMSLKCEVLINRIVDYVNNVYNPYRFLENETNCFLLEPESLVEVLNKINFSDSKMINVVMNWGQDYIKKNQKFGSVTDLFKAFAIDRFLKKDFQIFGELKTATIPYPDYLNQLFDGKDISELLLERNVEIKNSNWKTMTKEESFTEEIVIKAIKCDQPINLLYEISTNYVVYYEKPDESKSDVTMLSAFISVNGEEPKKTDWKYRNDNRKINQYIENYTTNFYFQGNNLNDTITLKINYKFLWDCRVFLTDRIDDKDVKKLCFTRDITLVKLF